MKKLNELSISDLKAIAEYLSNIKRSLLSPAPKPLESHADFKERAKKDEDKSKKVDEKLKLFSDELRKRFIGLGIDLNELL